MLFNVLVVGALVLAFFTAGILAAASVGMIIGGTWLLVRFVMLTWKMARTPKGVWERNRRAKHICRKVNKGKMLSPAEEEDYYTFFNHGIIGFRGIGINKKTNVLCFELGLSNNALKEVLQ